MDIVKGHARKKSQRSMFEIEQEVMRFVWRQPTKNPDRDTSVIDQHEITWTSRS